MASVSYRNATRFYAGTERPAVSGLDLDIEDGEFMVLVGPSGSGKSTALRMLAGLEGVDGGSIHIGERDVTELPPRDRDIAMVFQNYALYPHMTVRQNIGYHLKIARRPKAEIARRVEEAATLLDIVEHLERKPAQLSGGQRQRVAMGRAIVREPLVFLMDEPLSNLDAKLRVQTRAQIAALQRRLGTTTVYVTHDQVEAMTMGDRVAVLDGGALQQCETPRALYETPANAFVAGFIGSPAMNLVTARRGGESAALGPFTLPLTRTQRSALNGDRVTIGVRPEGFDVVEPDSGWPAVVDAVEELGHEAYLYVTADLGDAPVVLTVLSAERKPPPRGARIGLALRQEAVHVFAADTGARLSD